MLKHIKKKYYTRKLKNLKIKHDRLLKEAESMTNHHHTHEGEELFQKIHIIENRIEHIEDRLNA